MRDYDWLVVGSGFGGSVSALRLAEKGYTVAVLECGSRFRDEDFAASTLREPRRYFWWPQWGMRGVLRMTFFKDVFVVSRQRRRRRQPRLRQHALPGPAQLLRRPAVGGRSSDWEAELAPHYDTAERMLGVVEYEGMGPADMLLKEYGEEHRRRRDLHQHQGRRLLRRAGRRGARTRSSKARGPSAPAACAAAAAWSAAATAPRTR